MLDTSPLLALKDAATALQSCGRRFALVGGLAVTIRSEVRFTRDVDLCVAVQDDKEAEQLVFDLRAQGYVVVATVEHDKHARLATARLRGPTNVVCDLLFASSGIEHEVVERATQVDVDSSLSLPVARVEELLALKVLSASDDRLLDTVDFKHLIEFNPSFDEAAVRSNLKLIEARGYQREQNLLEKLDVMLSRIKLP